MARARRGAGAARPRSRGHPRDRRAARRSSSSCSRGLGLGRDLYNACARLGRLLADAGASPSLAVATLDGAARALAALGVASDRERASRRRERRSPEGYFAVTIEGERAAGATRVGVPRVRGAASRKDTVAIAAGYPADDGEALADWSARVALAVSREGYKRAVLAGPDATTGGAHAGALAARASTLGGRERSEGLAGFALEALIRGVL